MEKIPICYQNSKLQYFSHYQFLNYRLLGKEKEKKNYMLSVLELNNHFFLNHYEV